MCVCVCVVCGMDSIYRPLGNQAHDFWSKFAGFLSLR